MKTAQFTLPLMYGDHHVLVVRQLLENLPGVAQVYASSSFRMAEVEYDSNQLDEEKIQAVLAEAGYMDELSIPTEVGSSPADEEAEAPFFRHTAVFSQTGSTIRFGQTVPAVQRPLWPCPGIKPVTSNE